jgi:uncharacterized protein (DUF3084 family)
MEYIDKEKELERVIAELMELQVPFAELSGEYYKMKARMQTLKELRSALQSSLKAEALL